MSRTGESLLTREGPSPHKIITKNFQAQEREAREFKSKTFLRLGLSTQNQIIAKQLSAAKHCVGQVSQSHSLTFGTTKQTIVVYQIFRGVSVRREESLFSPNAPSLPSHQKKIIPVIFVCFARVGGFFGFGRGVFLLLCEWCCLSLVGFLHLRCLTFCFGFSLSSRTQLLSLLCRSEFVLSSIVGESGFVSFALTWISRRRDAGSLSRVNRERGDRLSCVEKSGTSSVLLSSGFEAS